MNLFLDYANNLSDNLLWMIIPLTIIGIGIGIHSWIVRDREYQYGSDRYSNATWRMMTCAQGIVISWIIWVLISAIPEPDYIIQERIVEKPVSQMMTYFEAFDACMERYQKEKFCDNRAILFTKPNSILQVTNTRIVEKKVIQHDPYAKLYADCTSKLVNETGIDLRRGMDQCDSQALRVRQ